LKDATEARLVFNLTQSIDAIFSKYGTDLKDREYIQLPEWKDVLREAKTVLNEFELKYN